MKGCARTLLLQFLVYVAAAGAVMFLLFQRWGIPPGKSVGISLGAGFLAWIALTLIFGVWTPVREMSALRGCLAGRRPSDGSRAGIAGTIDAEGPKLRAPLSGTDCLAFKYDISIVRGAGRRRYHTTFFEGIGLTSSVIATNAGTFRLLAVPAFDFRTEPVETGLALRNWEDHLATARFEPEGSRRTLEKQWTDDDGSYRCEKNNTRGVDAPLAECTFQESLILPGEKVYAVGLYSDSRGGFIPHPNWAKETRIMKGDGESVLRQLPTRIVRYLVGGIVFAGGAAGVVWAFVSHVTGM